ncbi:MAG: chemotaxis protein [Sulfurimonas sp.]|uniref:chemotaxis protein n=1 Tax=Sulfurimonas sp. TaxID=2022749 RepID=UPI00260C8A0D|nr:chemotaxis protein [Sulfurimonas sp.]MDD2652972.1 chemotaxis protein [Sulfurimonas sp.]MDD3452418.1 chemotaxis protein [Sulfurimonas sp.]
MSLVYGELNMTQEELDCLLIKNSQEDALDIDAILESEASLLPMPAIDENKMVYQLDNVTRESEEKAVEIFDNVEAISNEIIQNQKLMKNTIAHFDDSVKFFTTLHTKFPDVKAFAKYLEINKNGLKNAKEIDEILEKVNFELMDAVDIMQYQDIHRQKIERVINVMRSLSKYMNALLEGGKVDNAKRVSSSQYIIGDTHKQVASNEEIEEMLAQFCTSKNG